MRLISWNVARAGQSRIPHQVTALAAREPDIIALQEVRINRVPDFRRELARIGFMHILDSFPPSLEPFAGYRAAGVLVASKWPCAYDEETASRCCLPWPERLLSARIETSRGVVSIANVYVPLTYASRKLDVRIRTLEGLYDGLARTTDAHRILCGDFNLPQAETMDGDVITFGQTRRKSGAFAITNAAMHACERKVLTGLAEFGLADVYRALYGYDRQEFSWYHAASGNGFRLDHVLASPSLGARACRYLDAFRTEAPEMYAGYGFIKLSDHAAIEVDFDPQSIG
jgi:exonuclease III